jgi:hypothetical protein
MARALLVAAALVAAAACVHAQQLLPPGPGVGLAPTENQVRFAFFGGRRVRREREEAVRDARLFPRSRSV